MNPKPGAIESDTPRAYPGREALRVAIDRAKAAGEIIVPPQPPFIPVVIKKRIRVKKVRA